MVFAKAKQRLEKRIRYVVFATAMQRLEKLIKYIVFEGVALLEGRRRRGEEAREAIVLNRGGRRCRAWAYIITLWGPATYSASTGEVMQTPP